MRRSSPLHVLALLTLVLLAAACDADPAGMVGEAESGLTPALSLGELECETDLFTPNGSLVALQSMPYRGDDAVFDAQVAECEGTCTIMESPRDHTYSCHSYAFIPAARLSRLCDDNRWLSSANMQIYLDDGSYVVTSANDPCATIVDMGEHTARILRDANGNKIMHPTLGEQVISKWGVGHLVKHYLYDGEFGEPLSGYPKYYKRADCSPPPPDPVTVTISGPFQLAVGERGTWTASPSGGTGTYSCSWDLKTQEHDWIWVSGAMSYSTIMHNNDGYLRVRTTCTSGSESASASRYVMCTDCGGGPMW